MDVGGCERLFNLWAGLKRSVAGLKAVQTLVVAAGDGVRQERRRALWLAGG